MTLKKSMTKNFLTLSFLCALLSCNHLLQKGNDGGIQVEIDRESNFLVNKDNISAKNLRDCIAKEVEELEKAGFAKEDIRVFINAHSEAKIGELSDLQMILRELGLRKIVYNSYR